MRHIVAARELVTGAARELELDPAVIDLIFQDTPVDFPVIITPRLPFLVHRFGMAGITLRGRVYLLEAALRMAPEELIVLLRHEAEHVRQQRDGIDFYPRYLLAWLRALTARSGKKSATRGAWYGAYRSIPAEREAYAAGERARELLRKRVKRK